MKLNTIYNEDCFITMDRMINQNKKVSAVITSPFYNTGRGSSCHKSQKSRDNYEGRYDVHLDNMTDDEYIDFTIRLFEKYDKIIKKNGVILYNISYGSENTHLMWLVIAEIIKKTNFVVADDIIWKKKSALPNNVSSNKLTRIVEHIFVFCRKSEFKTHADDLRQTATARTVQHRRRHRLALQRHLQCRRRHCPQPQPSRQDDDDAYRRMVCRRTVQFHTKIVCIGNIQPIVCPLTQRIRLGQPRQLQARTICSSKYVLQPPR